MVQREDNGLRSDIPMLVRGLAHLQPETFVTLSYHPQRGKYSPKERRGFVNEVSALTDAGGEFTFYDDEIDRDIKVRISRTTGQSTVRSRKNRQWRTIGTPLRVGVFTDVSDPVDVFLQPIDSPHETGDEADSIESPEQEHAVVAASVAWNARLLEWFEWTEADR